MIETYKIVTGKYDASVAPSLANDQTYVTRGNKLKLNTFPTQNVVLVAT